MYALNTSAFGLWQRYIFSNPVSGNGFSIVPGAGANVLDIQFGGQNILDGHETPEELAAGKWGKSTILFPFPNRLHDGQYTWEGKIYSFLINNTATNNAIHGFARDHVFAVDKVELTPQYAALWCSLEHEGHPTGYPFAFTLQLKFVIDDTNTFSLHVTCLNRHHQAIPVGFGWHPYFRLSPRANDHFLKLPDCSRVDIDDRMIPTGKRLEYTNFQRKQRVSDTFLDTCFVAKKPGPYRLDLWGGNRKISVTATGAQCPFFQVFTPPHRESIALEPMSCNVNAFNNREGLVTLASGKVWKASMTVQSRQSDAKTSDFRLQT